MPIPSRKHGASANSTLLEWLTGSGQPGATFYTVLTLEMNVLVYTVYELDVVSNLYVLASTARAPAALVAGQNVHVAVSRGVTLDDDMFSTGFFVDGARAAGIFAQMLDAGTAAAWRAASETFAQNALHPRISISKLSL